MKTRSLGFVILWVQVSEIAEYEKDIVFLIVPDESDFLRHMPLVIEMCTLERIVNVIKESWAGSTSWAMMQASCFLCQCGTATSKVGEGGSTPMDEGATMSVASPDQEIDKWSSWRKAWG